MSICLSVETNLCTNTREHHSILLHLCSDFKNRRFTATEPNHKMKLFSLLESCSLLLMMLLVAPISCCTRPSGDTEFADSLAMVQEGVYTLTDIFDSQPVDSQDSMVRDEKLTQSHNHPLIFPSFSLVPMLLCVTY